MTNNMTQETQKETHSFQTEVKQLLNLMVHSLYSNKEIFLRELISNASDAADKLRFKALNDDSLYENQPDLKVTITFDKDAKTLTIADSGIGMNKEEVVSHLGTIAKSGTSEFLSKMTGDEKKDSQLIGQFGVGFYSSFIVANEVSVTTRKPGQPVDEAIQWVSKGDGEFTLETVSKEHRGTEITLHLKDDELEFADGSRLRALVRKYSDHISIPVEMVKESQPEFDDEGNMKEPEADKPTEFEAVNSATALWTKSRTEIKDEEYQEFYKHISHDYQDASVWSHNKVEGKLEYTSLLYVPAKAPFDMYNREQAKGLKLYVQRVFIMDEAEQFLPTYLRFIKGVIDSNDLSLNVSREILQSDKTIDSMRGALTKRVIDMLSKMAKKDEAKYTEFYKEFGQVLKEGPAEDNANKEKILNLLRFSTTHTDKEAQDQSLKAYADRMKEGQDKIYYITAENFITGKNSPHLEVFRKKGIEVIILSDRVDEWMMGYVNTYDGKSFQNVAKGELDLTKFETEEEKKDQKETDKNFESLLKQVKEVLKDQVEDVRLTYRLTDSPACLVLSEHDMGSQMRKIMEAAGQAMPESKATLELNPEHPLVIRLNTESDDQRVSDLSHILFEQAQLAEGGQLKDPAAYVKRLNTLLLSLAG